MTILKKIKKYFFSNKDELNWFASKAVDFINNTANSRKEQIECIKVFYNAASHRCIVRLEMKNKTEINFNGYLYFLLDYTEKDLPTYGIKLERNISDNNKTITWINNNKVFIFNPEPTILELLAKRLM